jgi:hypothetical protein
MGHFITSEPGTGHVLNFIIFAKKMTKYPIILLLLSMNIFCFSQKKKEIKNFGIKTIKITETKNEKILNDETTIYNDKGEVAEEINYDKQGVLKSTVKYKYNLKGNVTEETEYDDKNMIKEIKQFKYDKFNRKTEELVTDKNNRILKKITYSFNNNGFKTERKTFDSLNNLISTKNYSYSYK